MAIATVTYAEPTSPPVKEVTLVLTPEQAYTVAAMCGQLDSAGARTGQIFCALQEALKFRVHGTDATSIKYREARKAVRDDIKDRARNMCE